MTEIVSNMPVRKTKQPFQTFTSNSKLITKSSSINQSNQSKKNSMVKSVVKTHSGSSDKSHFNSGKISDKTIFSKSPIGLNLKKNASSNVLHLHENVFDFQFEDDNINQICSSLMSNLKNINTIIDNSKAKVDGNKPDFVTKPTFQAILLSKAERESQFNEMIEECNKRYNIYEAHLTTIKTNLFQIKSSIGNYDSKIAKSKYRACSNLETIDSNFQEGIFDQEDRKIFLQKTLTQIENSLPKKKSLSKNNQTQSSVFDSITSNPNSGKSPYNCFNKSSNKNKLNKQSTINTRNTYISINSTINNNNSTIITNKPTPKEKKRNLLKTNLTRGSRMESNQSVIQVETQSNLAFTINNTNFFEISGPKITSRYEENEMEELSTATNLKNLNCKMNNLSEKSSSPKKKRFAKTIISNVKSTLNDDTFEEDIDREENAKALNKRAYHHNSQPHKNNVFQVEEDIAQTNPTNKKTLARRSSFIHAKTELDTFKGQRSGSDSFKSAVQTKEEPQEVIEFFEDRFERKMLSNVVGEPHVSEKKSTKQSSDCTIF